MRELILVTAHVPDLKREQLLRNFVNNFTNTDKYDVMICTHTPIPIDIAKNVEHIIYEKENNLLTDINQKYIMYYQTNIFKIVSTEVAPFNHYFAIMRSIGAGLSNAKNLGYKKVHYFEYDTDFEHLDELKENSELLDDYNIVYYNTGMGEGYPNSPVSLNIDNISKNWFKYDYEHLYNFVNIPTSKTIEEYEFFLIGESGKCYEKQSKDLNSRGIINALNSTVDSNPWNILVVDKSNTLNFFGNNELDKINNIEIIIDGTLINLKVMPKRWLLYPVGNYNKIKNITIIVNGKVRSRYDFTDEEFKYNFRIRNKIKNV